jgi:polyisoprenoid-binding protein YceI
MVQTAAPKIQVPAPGQYTIDPRRSTIEFTTRHMFGMGKVTGSLRMATGSLTVAQAPEDSHVVAHVAADSFSTAGKLRDNQVKSRMFLDARRYPTLSFDSNTVRYVDGGLLVEGTLTARGTAESATFAVTSSQVTPQGARVRAEARIDRYAHGVKKMKGMAARHLTVVVDAWINRA